MHDEREEKYSKTQKRPPDYGKPDRAGEAIASYYDGGNYSWNNGIFMCDLPDDSGRTGHRAWLTDGAAGTSLSVQNMWLVHTPVKTILTVMIVNAVLRGILHYAEQYCNHFIAFKLLAIIRHKVFAALRKLCPAKLEGRDKGNLISIITTDIELLEVFYAHTISPIAIAALTSLIMVCFIGRYHVLAGLLALAAYLTVGVVIPMWNGKRGSQKGMEFRTGFGELNSFVLDSLRGLDETIQYGQGEKRKEQMSGRSKELTSVQET